MAGELPDTRIHIVPAVPFGDVVVQGQKCIHFNELRLPPEFYLGDIRRNSRRRRGEHPLIVGVPGNPLRLDANTGMFSLELLRKRC